MRILAIVAFWLALAAPAAAQCLSGTTAVWPTQLAFQPAQPAAGQPVAAVLGAPISGGIANARRVRSGASIELRGEMFTIDFATPPPPSTTLIELGGLPQGTYTVTAQLTESVNGMPLPCVPLQAQLVVGGGGPVIESVPALSGAAAFAILAALLLLVAARARSGRAPPSGP